MTAAIVDDELHCIETLQSMLAKYTEVEVVAHHTDSVEAAKQARGLECDILFIDIEMPHLNGFEFLDLFPEKPWHVIFTTAYDQYAVQAFKVNAIDYLLKPIAKDDLLKAIEKAKARTTPRTEPILQKVRQEFSNRLKKIAVPTLAGLELMEISNIQYLVSEGNYVYIVLSNGQKHLVSKTLKAFEEQMVAHGFIRVHNSYIVNPDFIQRYVKGDGGYLVLKNDEHIPVSRSRKPELLERMKQL